MMYFALRYSMLMIYKHRMMQGTLPCAESTGSQNVEEHVVDINKWNEWLIDTLILHHIINCMVNRVTDQTSKFISDRIFSR